MGKKLYWSAIGLTLLPLYYIQATDGGAHGTVPSEPIRLESPLRGIDGIPELVNAILDVLILVGIPIAALFIVYSGFLYVTARGDETKIKDATKALTWTIVGTAVLLGAVVISNVIGGTIAQITQ